MAITLLKDIISATNLRQNAPLASRNVNAAIKTLEHGSPKLAPESIKISNGLTRILQSSGLRNASIGFAQFGSLLETTKKGITQVSNVVDQLKNVAQKSSQTPTIESQQEFTQHLSKIDAIVKSMSFDGTNLVDGSDAGTNLQLQTEDSKALSLPNLTSQALLGTPKVDTKEAAGKALNAITVAKATITDASDTVNELQIKLSFASASVHSALANQLAATSLLGADDFTNNFAGNGLSTLLGNPTVAAQAQGNNLPPSLLELLNG